MASCFVDVEYIEELKNTSENEKKKNSMEWWKNLFKKWVNERNLQANLDEYKNDVPRPTIVAVLKHSEIQEFCPPCY